MEELEVSGPLGGCVMWARALGGAQSAEEEREREAIEAAAQRLPAGIRAVPAPRAVQGACRSV